MFQTVIADFHCHFRVFATTIPLSAVLWRLRMIVSLTIRMNHAVKESADSVIEK